MPFKSKAQEKWMYANKPEMAKEWSKHTEEEKALPEKVPHHSGKGTRARLNTAAERLMFNSKFSK